MKIKKYKNLARYVAPRDRRNPQVLRFVFAHLIHRLFDGKKKNAYENLQIARNRSGKKPFNKHNLHKVLMDDQAITYAMLESFAHQARVPTWLLLLFSRSVSDDFDARKADGKISDIEREAISLNIERTIRFLVNIQEQMDSEKRGKPLEIHDLDLWIDTYLETTPSQADLDLPHPDD